MKNLVSLLIFGMVALMVSSFTGSTITGSAVGLAATSVVMPAAGTGMAFMAIPIQDARNVFTKMVVAVYKEDISVMSFLRSFFPEEQTMSKEISIEVERGFEKVAVDVERGTNGNRNTFSKSTEKSFVPPFYWEYMTANEHELYDLAISLQTSATFAALSKDTAGKMVKLKQKIERRYELQCAQVLETGIVQLNHGVNIDFKRKAASLVDATGNTWATGTNDPNDQLIAGAKFLRDVGKAQGSIVNVLMGEDAYNAYVANAIVIARADVRNFKLDDIHEPQRNSVGGSLQGQVSAGAYTFNLWTYPESHDDVATGLVATPYLAPKKIILLPQNPKFKLVYGPVPQLIGEGGKIPQNGAYLIQDFVDERATAHEMHIKSAGVAIPVAIDQIWTAQVLV